MIKKQLFVFTLLLFVAGSNIQAQIFKSALNKVVDRTADKLANQLEDALVEKISEEIAMRAFRPIQTALDSAWKTDYNRKYPDGEVSYDDYISKMLSPVDLPPSYTFDLTIEGETREYDGEKNDIVFLMSKTEPILGVRTVDGKEESTIVMDSGNNVMAIYTTKNGKTKIQGLPSMMGLASAMAKEEASKMTVERKGGSKKIAGYKCTEYYIEDETTTSKAWIAEDFPASWADAFDDLFKQMSPNTRKHMVKGMMLRSETKTKKKKKKSSYDTKKVTEAKVVLDNSSYKKTQSK